MSWILDDPKFIPIGILHYFHAGISRDDALANLLKSHESNPTIFPRIDYRDVDFWYKSFQERNLDLDQVPEHPELSMLENLPVLDKVIHEMNADDQQALRQVSTTFRNFINSENRLFDEIDIRITNNSILLKVENGTTDEISKISFKKLKKGCEINEDGEIKNSEKDFIEAGLEGFKETIQLVHTKVQAMYIRYNENKILEANREKFLAGIAEIFSQLKEKLHVELLNLTVKTPEQLEGILKGIKPGSLNHLEIDGSKKSDNVFKLSEVPSFKNHLNFLNQLFITAKVVDMKIKDFAGISNILLELEEITPEEAKIHRYKLLQFPNLQSQTFFATDNFLSMDDWRQALEPFEPYSDDFDDSDNDDSQEFEDNSLSGCFSIPDDDEHQLVFKVERYPMFNVKFSKKAK